MVQRRAAAFVVVAAHAGLLRGVADGACVADGAQLGLLRGAVLDVVALPVVVADVDCGD